MSRHSASLANWQALSDQLPESCLRIASYNVHGCVGTDGRKDAARIAEVIRELECDTVGLQEVDYRLDYIAGRVAMHCVPGLTLVRHDGPFGNALLTTRKVLDVRRSALAAAASDHLPVKAIVATQSLRWDPHALSKDADAAVGKFPIYAGGRGS